MCPPTFKNGFAPLPLGTASLSSDQDRLETLKSPPRSMYGDLVELVIWVRLSPSFMVGPVVTVVSFGGL